MVVDREFHSASENKRVFLLVMEHLCIEMFVNGNYLRFESLIGSGQSCPIFNWIGIFLLGGCERP